ncbi:MAG: glutathione synthase [Candidatus Cloacimonetes bacterium]|nr:glutathione synthase [Candidatus Cloacimonadota bacterium]
MNIGFLVNSIETERSSYTTIRLALTAINRGHKVFMIGVANLSVSQDEMIYATSYVAAKNKYKTTKVLLNDFKKSYSLKGQIINLSDLDVLLLRNDPSNEPNSRSWAKDIGIDFGRLASRKGVIVLNDPNGLSNAMDKMYLMQFPEEVRPKTVISRNPDDIRKFARLHGKVVLKPLSGSGGRNVFLLRPDDLKNINQIIEAVSRDGYIMAQEYLPEAAQGDIRLFMMNGLPLKYKGKYAAFKRVGNEEDLRSNVHVGGRVERALMTDQIERVASIVRPKLAKDGMFLVGVDIVGDKILELNVFSPGGLGKAQSLEGVNFTYAVIKALEKKVEYMGYYNRKFDNNEMANL